jgi:hypothetical protein
MRGVSPVTPSAVVWEAITAPVPSLQNQKPAGFGRFQAWGTGHFVRRVTAPVVWDTVQEPCQW